MSVDSLRHVDNRTHRYNAGYLKRSLSPGAREVLRRDLAYEYELVDFLRRRIQMQKRSLGIS